jgi:hypothetical protein
MDEFTIKYFKHFYKFRNKEIKFNFIKEEKNKIKGKLKKINYKIIPYEIPENKIKKLIDTEWVYSEVINQLDNLNVNFKITWYYKTTHNIYIKCKKEKYIGFCKRLHILLNMINYLYDLKKYEENKPINMYLVLTPLKKNLDIESVIGPKNINSGYTDFIVNEIFVWREEEFEKVIFHELIHYMDLDVRNMAFDDKDLPHNINGYKSYFEAFTDFWGIVYHLIYVSIVLNKSVNSLFQIEFKFMENQANLINDFFRLDNWDDKKEINQKSPAFTYFIIKYMLFNEILNSNNMLLLDNPRELMLIVLSKGFKTKRFLRLPPRMTLIQL